MTNRALDNPPLVSVIVPVFNGEEFLRESLDSILAQSYPRIEVIVMDDASTDGTPAVAASYGQRVKSHRQPLNRGIYGNANDGIAMARGEYIAVYHADDIYEPTMIEREVEFLERHPETGAVFCKDVMIDPAGREEGRLHLPPEVPGGRPLDYRTVLNALLKYKNIFLMCPSAMVRASVHRQVGVYRDDEFRNTSDLEMWLRIAQRYPVGVLDEYLFRYRFGHGNSAQRYHRLRTDPERFFTIMDLYLEQGGRALAAREALAGYEAHRTEDQLKRSINAYILGQLATGREILHDVRLQRLLASPVVQRGRLTVLFFALWILSRLPKVPLIANLLNWRFYGKGAPRRGSCQPWRAQEEEPLPAWAAKVQP
jgi:glycosyltransferase involved in cell wall biosynthesis